MSTPQSQPASEPLVPTPLLHCPQKECNCLESTAELLYSKYEGDLSAQKVGELYSNLRHGGVSLRQVRAAVCNVCGTIDGGRVSKGQMGDLFLELDRRYFIVESARWEFAMIDRSRSGVISEQEAMFLFKAVQGDQFMESWVSFRKRRQNAGSKVTWEELEVPLCDIVLNEGEEFPLRKLT